LPADRAGTATRATRQVFAGRGWWLPALLVLTLALRTLSAKMPDPIRNDSVYYIACAQNLASGDLPTAVRNQGPNVYPVILLAIHKLGVDYESGGKFWGVLVSTATLLPLVGLARRQFGRPVAMVTGFLYAVHPRFIEWGSEIIRDPTFWLSFVLTLYFLRRGLESRPWAWRLAAGISLAFAIHLRIEGWLLLLPVAANIIPNCRLGGFRQYASVVPRLLLLLGVPAAALLTLNLAIFRDNPQWARLDHVFDAVTRSWSETQNSGPAKAGPAVAVHPRSPSHQAVNYLKKVVKGVDPWLILPMCLGLYRLRRRWRAPEHASVLVMSGTIYALIVVYLIRHGEINTRYTMAAVLTLLPYAAYGLFVLLNWLGRTMPSRWAHAPGKARVVQAVSLLLLLSGVWDGLDVNRAVHIRDATLGRWVRDHCGAGMAIASWQPRRAVKLFNYYADTDQYVALPATRQEDWEPVLRRKLPDVVLVEDATQAGREFVRLAEEDRELGYREVFVEVATQSPRRVFVRDKLFREAERAPPRRR